MGGNAIKTVPIRRYDRKEYEELCIKIKDIFTNDSRVVGTRIHITQCFREKQDFGDVDILIQGSRNLQLYKDLFSPKEIHCNGSVISLEHEGFQMDFIEIPSNEFEMAKAYFDFNDISNLIGKTARNLGLKYGHRGLTYMIRDGIGEKIGEVVVTKDPEEALTFLGYDWNRFQRGFNNLEEIFQYVASSKYFNVESYALDKLNHVDRIRDKKRKTYQEFLKWIEGKEFPEPFLKANFLVQIRMVFPKFSMKYDLALAKAKKRAAAKAKFNGDLVSEITGLKREELGTFMQYFRSEFETEEALYDYILEVSSEHLSDVIRGLQKEWEM